MNLLSVRINKVRLRMAGLALAVGISLVLLTLPALAQAVYNSRYDVNGDGTINVVDIQTVAAAWGANGNPYNDRELIVAKEGGEYLTIGAAVAAIHAASNAGPASPYVIRVLPGAYVESVTLPAYTHLLGSGQETTIISSTVSNAASPPITATLVLGDQSRASHLTVVNQGANLHSIAILLGGGASATLQHVTAKGIGNGQGGSHYAVYLRDSGTTLWAQSITAQAEGSYSDSYGLYNDGATATVEHSTIVARDASRNGNWGVLNDGASLTLRHSTVTASGGNRAVGLYNTGGTSLEVEHSTIKANGPNAVYGIENVNNPGSTLEVRHSTFAVSSVARAWGVRNDDTFLLLSNSYISASGSDYAAGIRNDGAAGALVESSQIRGNTRAVDNRSNVGWMTRLRHTVLGWGPAVNVSGALSCTDVSEDDQGRRLNESCGTEHYLNVPGGAGQPVFRSVSITYGNAPTVGNWSGSLCLGFAADGSNDNTARRLIYPVHLPAGAKITHIDAELWDTSVTGVMTSTLASRPFGAASNAVPVGEIGVSSGTGGWQTVGQDFNITLDPDNSYFIRVDFQTGSDMSATCVGGHRITYELYGH